MSMEVSLPPFEGGPAAFGIDEKRFERIQINSTNRAARWVKRVLLVEPFSEATGVRRVIFNDRIRINLANRNVPEASIVPSSASIPARCYRHRADPVDGSKVSARVLVDWWQGEKIAAGFINPSSDRKLPLATRSVRARKLTARSKRPHIKEYRYEYWTPEDANGPSAAALFRVAVDNSTREQAADRLAFEFNKDLDEELF
ncbi:hypothetical protein [Stutzerimonas nitrititolerans]|uniref:hypothetical protein n=1 Tax=Stutzerimonas nitrititolerans TaxID=2482751 RepID=UPI0028A6330F|nr:hypothetical protein [Stutzerimonas nitrititolerans]